MELAQGPKLIAAVPAGKRAAQSGNGAKNLKKSGVDLA